MSDVPEEREGRPEGDVSGRDRISRSVLTSWLSHGVFVVAGFVLPRQIDRAVGQASLGIWDFCWSFVGYFGMMGLGIGSSVNRYVARARATGDAADLRKTVSSVALVQRIMGSLVALLTVVLSLGLPVWFSDRLGASTGDASRVLVFLGLSLSVQFVMGTNAGIMTGCHRWDLHNLINSVSYAIAVFGMIVLLLAGFGIRGIAAFYLLVTCVTEAVRCRVARSVCPEAVIGMRWATYGRSMEMMRFGLKSAMTRIPIVLVTQSASLMVAANHGAKMLAVFSRPSGLTRSTQVFMNKFAFVLTPTVGSLQGAGKEEEIRELFLESLRFSVALALPIHLLFGILAGPILRAWMGAAYAQTQVLPILALCWFLPVVAQPAWTILQGLNRHGRPAAWSMAIALASLAVSLAANRYRPFSLEASALMVGLPMALGNGAAVILLGARIVGVPWRRVLSHAFLPVAASNLPVAGLLLATRRFFPPEGLVRVGAAAFLAFSAAAAIYYRAILTPAQAERVRSKLRLGKRGGTP
jgi:O-antigen/teichoic acid export membrane protein